MRPLATTVTAVVGTHAKLRSQRRWHGWSAVLHAAIAVAAVSFVVGCESDKPFGVESLVDGFSPQKPLEVVEDAFNPYDSDKRRRAITMLAAAPWGGEEPYLRAYRLLLEGAGDDDPTVRAACVRALGIHGTTDDASILARRLSDSSALVRWEAAEALQKIHNPVAIEALNEAVHADRDTDVRASAAAALGQYASPEVFSVLVGALNDDQHDVVRAAWLSLKTLTGQDLDTTASAWLAFAEAQPARLFVGQQPYYWQPYDKPPTLLDKAQFWKDHKTPDPRRPTGLETTVSTGEDARPQPSSGVADSSG